MALIRVLGAILLLAALCQASLLRASKREVPHLVLVGGDSLDFDQLGIPPFVSFVTGPGLSADMVQKMGTSSLQTLLRAAVPGYHTQFMGESVAGDFHIAVIRNPCEWYVSLWAYGVDTDNACQGKDHPPHDVQCGGMIRKELRLEPDGARYLKNSTEDKTSDKDIATFRAFVHHIHGDYANATGAYTGRVVAAFVGGGPNHFVLSREEQEKEASNLRKRLAEYNTSNGNCWVDLGRLTSGVRGCLKAYEKVGGEVRWQDFEAQAKAMDGHRAGVTTDTGKDASGRVLTNPSKHQSCGRYFDDELETFVRKIDDVAFSKFGFSQCCAGVSKLSV